MNKIFSILLLSLTAVCLQAQPGVLATRHANPSDGREITMEEAVYSRKLHPSMPYYAWNSKNEIVRPGKYSINPETGDTTEISRGQRPGRPELPEGASNITKGGGKYCAFTSGNGLYACDGSGNIIPIAVEDNPEIVFGQYVSRNEFGINSGIFWSNSGKKLAFYRKDNSLVSSFPLLDITSRTGTLMEIKYPMAGMSSENVRVGIYDFASNTTTYIQADDFGYDQYLTNITWAPDDGHIFIQVLDRSQKHMRLNMYGVSDGKPVKTILSEDSEKYVEPSDPLYFIKGSNEDFIYVTNNRDGYRNLYLCDTGGKIERLTEIDADAAYVANDGKYVYYTSAEISPVENHLFRISLKSGKKERLTFEQGWHNVSVSPDGKWFIDRWSSLDMPGRTDLASTDGKIRKTLAEAEDPTDGYAFTEVSLGTVKSADGKYDNYYRLIKPKDFDPAKKYPVILYVYGGPHSQMVRDTWLAEIRLWEMYMAQRGYLVYIQDNRGTSNRGTEYEQAIYGRCGQAEMADQMEGIKMLCGLPYVDSDRIGVHGWSYGGFMTISLITNYPETFKVAVAGGPVIDWKWYEVMYGERYMGNPSENAEGYEKVSLINRAGDLKGKLLICQGAVDNVVVWQHSLNFIRKCIEHNVQVDYFPYPCAEHNVTGKDRIHLMDKVTMYFEDYL